MACIIKIPENDSKGVITFTTQERDKFILSDNTIIKKIKNLKNEWIIGLHHNWHDYKFKYNPLFDFSMAGEGDLREKDGVKFPILTLDACNFVPKYFYPGNTEKFWDILYVARAVKFKKINEFFQCIRRLYDVNKKYRVLFICPVPPYKRSEKKTVFYDIRKVYDKMFTEEEKNLFTLLTIDYRYPFPFDLPSLAHFYKSSKIFVHFANDERRCRVAAYAWATGLPVVGMSCIGSLLPKTLQKKPYYYEVSRYEQFDESITEALKTPNLAHENNEVVKYFDISSMRENLNSELQKIFKINGLHYNNKNLLYENLDIRLGRHVSNENNPNSIKADLGEFIDLLGNKEKLIEASKKIDPEIELASYLKKTKKTLFGIVFGNK